MCILKVSLLLCKFNHGCRSILLRNKKVLLRECKRHTARCVGNARYAALSNGWGGTPSSPGGGYPGYPSPTRPGRGGTPGTPPPSRLGTTQTWDGVSPLPRPGMGYPPPLRKCGRTENITSPILRIRTVKNFEGSYTCLSGEAFHHNVSNKCWLSRVVNVSSDGSTGCKGRSRPLWANISSLPYFQSVHTCRIGSGTTIQLTGGGGYPHPADWVRGTPPFPMGVHPSFLTGGTTTWPIRTGWGHPSCRDWTERFRTIILPKISIHCSRRIIRPIVLSLFTGQTFRESVA